MKHFVHILALGLSLSSAALAGPLQKEQIPADAKWLLHLDADDFRHSKVGSFVISQIMQQKQFMQPIADLKRQFQFQIDPTNILSKIKSITAFGSDFRNPQNTAVVLIKTDADLQTVLVGALAGMSLASNSAMPVVQTQEGDITLYSVKDQVYIAVAPGKGVLVGRTKEVTEKAVNALSGKAPNMKTGATFSEFQELPRTFFFLGVAEGFSADEMNLPQARVLQMADGGRVVLGENAGQLFVNLGLKAKTSEVVTQMQQVLQGLLAIVSLGKSDNKDITDLIQSIKVTSSAKTVSVNVEYPTDKAIEKFAEVAAHSFPKRAPRAEQAPKSGDNAEASSTTNKN